MCQKAAHSALHKALALPPYTEEAGSDQQQRSWFRRDKEKFLVAPEAVRVDRVIEIRDMVTVQAKVGSPFVPAARLYKKFMVQRALTDSEPEDSIGVPPPGTRFCTARRAGSLTILGLDALGASWPRFSWVKDLPNGPTDVAPLLGVAARELMHEKCGFDILLIVAEAKVDKVFAG